MVKVSSLIDEFFSNNVYDNCRIIVIDEHYKIIFCDMLEHILFKTYKFLKNYELVSWSTDFKLTGNVSTNVCVVFCKFINDNKRVSA